MNKMRKRNEWDVLKCLATLLVVIGHIVILYKQGGEFSGNGKSLFGYACRCDLFVPYALVCDNQWGCICHR